LELLKEGVPGLERDVVEDAAVQFINVLLETVKSLSETKVLLVTALLCTS
jgi:hypothetical protein